MYDFSFGCFLKVYVKIPLEKIHVFIRRFFPKKYECFSQKVFRIIIWKND